LIAKQFVKACRKVRFFGAVKICLFIEVATVNDVSNESVLGESTLRVAFMVWQASI
jgi:hypothetical protein